MRRKNRVLDPARPYGTIHGGVRILYTQDNLVFEQSGKEVTSIDDPTPLPEPQQPEYYNMPILQIKRLVEKSGGEYLNKQQGIEYLIEQKINQR